jgi:hypothetical protein
LGVLGPTSQPISTGGILLNGRTILYAMVSFAVSLSIGFVAVGAGTPDALAGAGTMGLTAILTVVLITIDYRIRNRWAV